MERIEEIMRSLLIQLAKEGYFVTSESEESDSKLEYKIIIKPTAFINNGK